MHSTKTITVYSTADMKRENKQFEHKNTTGSRSAHRENAPIDIELDALWGALDAFQHELEVLLIH